MVPAMRDSVRITDVQAIYLRTGEFDESTTDSSRDALVVRVVTESGLTGYGEVDSSPLMAKAAIEAPASHPLSRGLRELLIGRDALDTAALWREMYEGTLYHGRGGAAIHAMAGVDLALWDLKGRALGQPVHRLLGGAYRDRIPAYASNLFAPTPEATAERARSAVEAGFRALKFGWEPFGRDASLDEALLAAVRAEVGGDVGLAVDAGLAWDARTTLKRLRLLERFDLMWLEEPLHPDDLRGYRAVTARSNVPIAAGEEECTRSGMLRLMDEGGIDIVQIDVTRTGLTQAMLIAGDAAERGLAVANHSYTTDLNSAASLHMLAAVPNALAFEHSFGRDQLSRDLVPSGIRFADGNALVPEGPGLGVSLDEKVIDRFRVT